MKSKRTFFSMLLLFCLLALAAGSGQAQGSEPLGDVDIQTKLDSAALAALGTSFTYQGQLKKDGNPVNDNCDFQFSLWDASSGGAQIGTTQTKINIAVSDGLFTIPDLDFGSVFTGDARWLQVAVRCPAGSGMYTNLSPRQALTAAPYALGLRPGAYVTGDISGAILNLHNTAASDIFATGVYGRSDSTAGTGVYGYANAASGVTYGVKGTSNSPTGAGVYGLSNTGGAGVHGTSSTGDGVRGETSAANKSGVYGVNTGSGFGVYGSSSEGHGMMGISNAGDGVRGETSAANKSGVYGVNTGSGFGVYGANSGSNNYGFLGSATTGVSGYGSDAGVYGQSSSGNGVFGVSSTGDGVRGQSSGANKSGVYGVNTGSGFGVYGFSSSGYAGGFRGNVVVFSRATGAAILELGEGLDYAEGFDVSDQGEISPGTVLVIDPDQPGKLTVSTMPYDRKVAGVVTGAKGLGSGVRLGVEQFDYDVALAGRVYCNVDATYGEVLPGDLLTTSPTPGYAMVVKDYDKAQGAILGKAMEGLSAGERGQILVLVSLQ